MRRKMTWTPMVLALAMALPALAGDKAPAQYWMSVTTGAEGMGMGAAMPSMSEMIMGGMFGGGGKRGGEDSQRSIVLQLSAPQVVTDPLADHFIPPGQNMGASLPLLTPKVVKQDKKQRWEEPDEPEKPKGRISLYWGCSDKARPGQPRQIDFAKASLEEYRRFFRSVHVNRPRGPHPANGWTYGDWPNEQHRQGVPRDSSLIGAHEIKANYAPTIRFEVGKQHDYLAPVKFTEMSGKLPESITFKWESIANAVGYFAMATGGSENELVIWVSSESAHMGSPMLDFIPTNEVRRLMKERVIMTPNITACQVPKGIFPGEGALLQFIAYGPDLDVSYPQRPANPPKNWQPDWIAKLRLKSVQSSLLGASMQGQSSGEARQEREERQERNPVKTLRGIFGF